MSIMTVQATELVIDRLILLITYCSVVPVVGYFRAWVAGKLGDDTPEQLGFLSLNPLEHISFFWVGVMVLGLTPFGFGRYIPLNPHNFYGRYRTLKMVTAFLSDTVASIAMALLALFIFVLLFGATPLEFIASFSHVRRAVLYSDYTATSSFAIASGLFLCSVVFFNSMLAAFNLIVNLFYAGFFYFYSSKNVNPQANDHVQWGMLIGPIILLILFVDKIQFGIVWLVMTIGMWFWNMLSLLS